MASHEHVSVVGSVDPVEVSGKIPLAVLEGGMLEMSVPDMSRAHPKSGGLMRFVRVIVSIFLLRCSSQDRDPVPERRAAYRAAGICLRAVSALSAFSAFSMNQMKSVSWHPVLEPKGSREDPSRVVQVHPGGMMLVDEPHAHLAEPQSKPRAYFAHLLKQADSANGRGFQDRGASIRVNISQLPYDMEETELKDGMSQHCGASQGYCSQLDSRQDTASAYGKVGTCAILLQTLGRCF